MASIEITGKEWDEFLEQDEPSFSIEDLILVGPNGSEWVGDEAMTSEEMGFGPADTLVVHDGTYTESGQDGESLVRVLSKFKDRRERLILESVDKPTLTIRGDTRTLRHLETMALSLSQLTKVGLDVEFKHVEGGQ